MKQTQKTIITAAVLIVILIAAVVGYNILTDIYSPDNFVPNEGNFVENETVANDFEAADPGDAAADTAEDTAPDFTVVDGDGSEVKLSDFFGTPIVVNFWATWCGPCQMEMPYFDEAYQNRDDVVFLMVNLTDGQRDTVESVKKFVEEEGYTFPVYFDTSYSAANAYMVYSIPMSIFIDAEGVIAAGHLGAMSAETLNDYISQITTMEETES